MTELARKVRASESSWFKYDYIIHYWSDAGR